MISYLKIYGPPLLKAIKALEEMAIDMPEVCIMDAPLAIRLGFSQMDLPYRFDEPTLVTQAGLVQYFGEGNISEERCDTIISKRGEGLGEYDFFFEWFVEPNVQQIEDLIEKIDETLAPLGVLYTISTKED